MLTTALSKVTNRLSKFHCLNGNQLKIIAVICMFIDHFTKTILSSISKHFIDPLNISGQISIGLYKFIYFFQSQILCGIGSIAFPLFCYLLVEGYCHTKSKGHYLFRISIFAVISELPFDLTFFNYASKALGSWPMYWPHQNVFFTYLMAICVLWIIEQEKKIKNKFLSIFMQGLSILTTCALAEFVVKGDYYGYGVFLIIVIYLFHDNRAYQLLAMLIVKWLIDRWSYPFFFLLALILIMLYNGKRGHRNQKWFFYFFYPVHIALLQIINYLLFRS